MFYDAYKKAAFQAESPRTIEYRIFAEITGELTNANTADTHFKDRINALFRNSQLWLTLETDLALPGNQLDKNLKANLISLAIWVRRFTEMAMKDKVDLEPLISVNRQIMEGLMMSEKNARQAARPQVKTEEFAQVSI